MSDEDNPWLIERDCVIWTGRDGKEHFEEDRGLAVLLNAGAVFVMPLNRGDGDAPDAPRRTALLVACNDVFMWGCSDCDHLPHDQIETVYRMWLKDPCWGTAVWCCQLRKEMPQRPVADSIRKGGIWDIDAMGLDVNAYDEVCRKHAEAKDATP